MNVPPHVVLTFDVLTGVALFAALLWLAWPTVRAFFRRRTCPRCGR